MRFSTSALINPKLKLKFLEPFLWISVESVQLIHNPKSNTNSISMKSYKDILGDAQSWIKDAGSNGTGKIIAAAAIGLAAGAVLGVLLAPASGAETRSSLSESLSGAGSTIKDKAKQGFDKLSELSSQAVDTVKSKVQGTGVADTTPAV